nr:DUF4932 domain-containing protein [uncultured Flavobacterium sp.]
MKIIINKKTWISILSCILFSVTIFAQKSYPPAENLNFTTKYIKANKNKFIVETPEVHELGNIAIALTKVGQIDSNMINMNTDYYKKVMTYFKPFENHPLIDTLNKYIHTPLEKNSYYYYFTIKMDACAFVFNGDKIENEGYIKKLSWPFYENPFDKHRELFEDFAKKSEFRKFYKSNKKYYTELVKTYKELNPVAKMQHWLQNKFKVEYGSYKAVFSPLVGGSHAANNYEANGFDHRFMFIAAAEYDKNMTLEYNILFESRVLFTEIDHHFVNPVSDKKREILKEIIGNNRQKWVNDTVTGTDSYPDGFSVFNEFMTWSLFSLYAYDNYSEEEVDKYLKSMVKNMDLRGFLHFDEFNTALIAKYNENKNISMPDLINYMIEWCSKK